MLIEFLKTICEFDQEILNSHHADQPIAPRKGVKEQ